MTDVTSPCPVEVSPEVLSDPAVVLFGLEHDFAVLQVERMSVDSIKVVVVLTAREGPCPACGVLTSAVKGTHSRPTQGSACRGAAGGAVVAQTSAGVPGDTVPTAIIHPDLYCGAAAGPGH